MGSIKEKIKYIKETKKLIREAIIARGVDVPENTTFRDYANKIDEIPSGVDINDYYNLTKRTSGDIKYYIKQIPMIDTSGYTSMSYMFSGYSSLKTIPELDTSKVTNMSSMFKECSSLTTIPQLNTSNVTAMERIFDKCSSLTTIPLLDTSKVTNMSYMFIDCSSLVTIPLLDTSKVTDMFYMFYNCVSLTAIPKLNTSNALNLGLIFGRCSSLATIPQLETSNVKNMYSMFYGCSSLTSIPQLDASNVDMLENIFKGCSSLITIGGLKDLGKAYDTTKKANYSSYTLNLSYSNNLTHDSLINIINNLYDIATKGCNPQQLVLGETNLAKLTAEEIAIATNKGWSAS